MDAPPGDTIPFLFNPPVTFFVLLSAIIVVLTSVASAAEAAFFNLDTDDIDRLKKSNLSEDKLVAELQKDPKTLLTTLVAFKYTLVATAAIILVTGLISSGYSLNGWRIYVAALAFAITLALFGIILPKIYGKENYLYLSKKYARLCRRLIPLYKPLLKPFFKMATRVENKLEKIDQQKSAEELNKALLMADADIETSESERDILQGIANFGSLTVKQVMRPRAEISFVNVSLDLHSLLDAIKRAGYSRIPVCKDSLDRIEGVLYIKDLLPFLNENENFNWQKLIRPAYFALETRKIDNLLKDFQEKRVHLAMVADEYGSITGLITLEDIIEEIIGDINDEFDEIGSKFQKIDERTFVFDGKTSVHDFCKILKVEGTLFQLAKSANKSVGSMLRQMHGAVPKVGEPVVIRPVTFIVEKMDNRRIRKVRVQLNA